MGIGLKFEDSGSLLKWNDRLSDLVKIDNPEIKKVNGNIKICWHNKVILNGIMCHPIVEIPDYESIEETFFESISITTSGLDVETKAKCEEWKKHIIKFFGLPIETKIDKEENEEFYLWKIDESYVRLMTYYIHSLRCSLIISTEPQLSVE